MDLHNTYVHNNIRIETRFVPRPALFGCMKVKPIFLCVAEKSGGPGEKAKLKQHPSGTRVT